MGHHEKLTKIDVREARTKILKSIAEYRKMHRLAQLFESFLLDGLYGKKLDARAAEKLQDYLFNQAEWLRTHRVNYTKTGMGDGVFRRVEYQFRIWLYDFNKDGFVEFKVTEKEDGTLNVVDAMIAHQKWGVQAEYMQEFLPKLAGAATRFNAHLALLKEDCEVALPPGEMFPVHPLSDYFHWYQLHGD